jgi:hypothetical protein
MDPSQFFLGWDGSISAFDEGMGMSVLACFAFGTRDEEGSRTI